MLLAANEYGCVPRDRLDRSVNRKAETCCVARKANKHGAIGMICLGDDAESDLFILMRAFRFAENNNFDVRRCAALSINAGRRSRSRSALGAVSRDCT